MVTKSRINEEVNEALDIEAKRDPAKVRSLPVAPAELPIGDVGNTLTAALEAAGAKSAMFVENYADYSTSLSKLKIAVKNQGLNPVQAGQVLRRYTEETRDQFAEEGLNTEAARIENRGTQDINNYVETGIRQFEAEIRKSAADEMRMERANIEDVIAQDPYNAGEVAENYLTNLENKLKDAGYADASIELELRKSRESLAAQTFNGLLNQDIDAATKFIEENKEVLGRQLPSFERKLENVRNNARKERSQLSKAMVQDELTSLTGDQIREAAKGNDEVASEARELVRDLESKPHKIIEDRLSLVSLKDPASLALRVAEVNQFRDQYSSANRPAEIPYFTERNLSNIKKAIEEGNAEQIVGDILAAGKEVAGALFNSLDKQGMPELGMAAKLAESDPTISSLILKSMRATGENSFQKFELEGISPFADEVKNEKIRKMVSNIGKVDGLEMGAEEVARRVANVHEIDKDNWFKAIVGGYDLALPAGEDAKSFTSKASMAFNDVNSLKKYLGSEPLGGYKPIEFEDVRLQAKGDGKYYILKDGRYLVDNRSQAVEFDFSALSSDEFTRDQLAEDMRRGE